MLMLLLLQGQTPTPNTYNYMLAGYAVIFGVILIYLISLAIRQRNFKKDVELLEELEQQNKK